MCKALLLSGGIDSIALAYWKRPQFAFTINYGQSAASAELEASRIVCQKINIKHITIDVDCSKLGSGDLLKKKSIEIAPSTEWWPYRNQLLVTLACMKAIDFNIWRLRSKFTSISVAKFTTFKDLL
jgi:7-cyano-7-deazaguanine synthase